MKGLRIVCCLEQNLDYYKIFDVHLMLSCYCWDSPIYHHFEWAQ